VAPSAPPASSPPFDFRLSLRSASFFGDVAGLWRMPALGLSSLTPSSFSCQKAKAKAKAQTNVRIPLHMCLDTGSHTCVGDTRDCCTSVAPLLLLQLCCSSVAPRDTRTRVHASSINSQLRLYQGSSAATSFLLSVHVCMYASVYILRTRRHHIQRRRSKGSDSIHTPTQTQTAYTHPTGATAHTHPHRRRRRHTC
jgi:hypothetical protein